MPLGLAELERLPAALAKSGTSARLPDASRLVIVNMFTALRHELASSKSEGSIERPGIQKASFTLNVKLYEYVVYISSSGILGKNIYEADLPTSRRGLGCCSQEEVRGEIVSPGPSRQQPCARSIWHFILRSNIESCVDQELRHLRTPTFRRIARCAMHLGGENVRLRRSSGVGAGPQLVEECRHADRRVFPADHEVNPV